MKRACAHGKCSYYSSYKLVPHDPVLQILLRTQVLSLVLPLTSSPLSLLVELLINLLTSSKVPSLSARASRLLVVILFLSFTFFFFLFFSFFFSCLSQRGTRPHLAPVQCKTCSFLIGVNQSMESPTRSPCEVCPEQTLIIESWQLMSIFKFLCSILCCFSSCINIQHFLHSAWCKNKGWCLEAIHTLSHQKQ